LPTLRNSLSLKQVLALYGNKANHKRSLIDTEGNSILLSSFWCHAVSGSVVASLCRDESLWCVATFFVIPNALPVILSAAEGSLGSRSEFL